MFMFLLEAVIRAFAALRRVKARGPRRHFLQVLCFPCPAPSWAAGQTVAASQWIELEAQGQDFGPGLQAASPSWAWLCSLELPQSGRI